VLQFKGVTKYLINSPFGALTLGAAYLTAALTATWFVVMAAKLDGVVEVSWGLASAPCWLALGCALVFSVFALGFHLPGYPLFGVVRGPHTRLSQYSHRCVPCGRWLLHLVWT
jgi:membrane protein implicated in regulation of membrane protease activity